MDDLDLMFFYKARQFASALSVKRVAEWKSLDVAGGNSQVREQWRLWAHHGIKIMTAIDKGICQID